MEQPRGYVRCPACRWRGTRVPRDGRDTRYGPCPKCGAVLRLADDRVAHRVAKARAELAELRDGREV